MNIISELSDDCFRIYRGKWGALFITLVAGLLCFMAGVVILYLDDGDLFVLTFGYTFLASGALILIGSPKYYKRLKEEGDDLLFEANATGILVSPVINTKPHEYHWGSISRIVLANKGESKSINDWGIGKDLSSWSSGNSIYNANLIIIYFRPDKSRVEAGLIKKLLNHIQESPLGDYYTYSLFPKRNLVLTARSLRNLCPSNVDVEQYSKVIFDYAKGTEAYLP